MYRHPIFMVAFLLLLFCNQSCKTASQSSKGNINDSIPAEVLAFLTTRDGNFEVYSMTADGKNVANLTNNKSLDFWSSWSPDGKYILFYSNRDGNNEIYRMDADGNNQINISNHPSNDYLPCWSPNGKQIVFTSDRDNKNREIYTMNIDGTNVIRLTNNDFFEEVPTWSNDGSKILFTRQLVEMVDTVKTTNGEIFIIEKMGKMKGDSLLKRGMTQGQSSLPMGSKSLFMARRKTKISIFFL